MITYHHAAGVTAGVLHGRPALVLPKEGRVVVDDAVMRLWTIADGKALTEILAASSDRDTDFVRAAMACLAEAGLLERRGAAAPPPPIPAPLVTGPAVTAV